MLIIHPHQIKFFDQQQEQQFRQTLCKHIQQEYPAYAELSPITLTRLIGFGLKRARSYGFTWQSSLGQFVYLMAGLAPNFDLHPAAHAVLTNPAIPVERRMGGLGTRLPEGVWADAAVATSTIGWFLTRDQFRSSRAERIAFALANVLPTDPDIHRDNWSTRVEHALQRAEPLGFTSEDQQWVFAAACVHYGDNFDNELAWAKKTFVPAFLPQTQISLLRVRMALDAGIWI